MSRIFSPPCPSPWRAVLGLLAALAVARPAAATPPPPAPPDASTRAAPPAPAAAPVPVAPAPARGDRVAEPARPCVLGLYDLRDSKGWPAGERSRDVLLGKRVRAAVEPLGYELRLHDLARGLPDDASLDGCTAIVTALNDPDMEGAGRYVRWLAAQIEGGRKVVLLNNFGAYHDAKSGDWLELSLVNKVFNLLGVHYDGQWTDDPRKLRMVSRDRKMFRRKPVLRLRDARHYYRFARIDRKVKAHLVIRRKDLKASKSAVVFSHPRGGMALTRYYEDGNGAEYLDLARFLRVILPEARPMSRP